MAQERKRRPLLIALTILAALVIAATSLAGVYSDILWFDQLGSWLSSQRTFLPRCSVLSCPR